MKNFFLCWLSFCSIAFAQAQNTTTLVQGTYNKEKVRSVFLFDVHEGEKREYASTRLTGEQHFAFAIPDVEEGFYYLTDQGKRDFVRIYLKKGDKINLEIGADGYQLLDGSAENKILKQWVDESYPVTRMAIFPRKDTGTFYSFFPALNNLLPKLPAFKKRVATPNKLFNETFKKAMDLEVELAVLKFLYTPNTVHPKKEDYPSFYNTIYEAQKFRDGNTLSKMGFGTDLITLYTTYAHMKDGPGEQQKKKTIAEQSNLFGSDIVKGIYVSQQLARFRSIEEFNKEIDPVKQFLVSDSMQARYFRVMKKLNGYKPGDVAYNFSYPDISGKQVSMASMKGKVVLVDVWATWCGPCKVEIPHLKKLEEELKDQNIEFVSISVDEEKDAEKWKNFVKEKELGGTQLYAKGWSDFAKFYDINAIPRFLVFDQEGKIVTVDAPRPSSADLKNLLLKTVEKKQADTKVSTPASR